MQRKITRWTLRTIKWLTKVFLVLLFLFVFLYGYMPIMERFNMGGYGYKLDIAGMETYTYLKDIDGGDWDEVCVLWHDLSFSADDSKRYELFNQYTKSFGMPSMFAPFKFGFFGPDSDSAIGYFILRKGEQFSYRYIIGNRYVDYKYGYDPEPLTFKKSGFTPKPCTNFNQAVIYKSKPSYYDITLGEIP